MSGVTHTGGGRAVTADPNNVNFGAKAIALSALSTLAQNRHFLVIAGCSFREKDDMNDDCAN